MIIIQVLDLRVTDLKAYENNPRNNDEAVGPVAESIKQFGFKVPIVIDKDNVIIAGHTRLKAAKKLGLETVPCIVADDLTDEQVRAFRLADNKVGELAEWNIELLEGELELLSDFAMNDFGFELLVEEVPAEEIHEDDYEIELPVEPIAKLGDVYQLGKHRLICGDCTNQTHIDLLMQGELADLVVTDPPYNMAYEGAGNTKESKRKKNRILNDKMSDDAFDHFLTDVYTSLYSVMKDGASFYVFYKELGLGVFLTALKKAGLTYKQELIWVKNQIVLGGSKYQSMYEPCLFGCKGKRIANWYAGRKERSVMEHLDLMNENELRKTLREILHEEETDIIRVDKNKVNDLHPTMKPIKLLSKLIGNSSKVNDVVVDFFGGSGSTLITCEQMNRRCFMSELDPKYVDVIIDRWEKLTGEKAVLLNESDRDRNAETA